MAEVKVNKKAAKRSVKDGGAEKVIRRVLVYLKWVMPMPPMLGERMLKSSPTSSVQRE